MSRRGWIRRPAAGGPVTALLVGVAIAMLPASAPGQATPGPIDGAPAPAVVEADGGIPALPPDVQVVRFQGPEGMTLEVLGPPTEPVPPGDGGGLATLGMRVGVGYRLRLANLPERPGAELFPVVEVVGHLHRPPDIDPAKFPIRVTFRWDDLEEAADNGRLVTQVVYLEDPEQAIPLSLPKDEIPIVTLSPTEEPVKVASALGRVMAIVHLGGRVPSADETLGTPLMGLAPVPCPFSGPSSTRCPLPCGPARGTAPPAGRPWLPRDEFLCDGGDHAYPVHFGGDGALRGIDPRDAVVQFRDDRRPRVLPTNVVCLYAPRFAAVRTSVGPNEALTVDVPIGAETVERQVTTVGRQQPRRLAQNQAAEANRERTRASGLTNRLATTEHAELRILSSADIVESVGNFRGRQTAELVRNRQKLLSAREATGPVTVRDAESAVVTGIVESAGQTVMAWKPQETAGVEVPPNKPGLAVVKQVSASEAEPGEVVTFTIRFRNMGNVPIGSVSIIDSLLPRLGYVAGSARGPTGSVFTADENRVGSTELRWDLPDAIAPGVEGSVSFQAEVR